MKHSLRNAFAISAALFALAASAQSARPVECPTMDFVGLKSGDGRLMVAAYNSAESFFKAPVWSLTVKVVGDTMRIPLCNVDAAEVAITAFQDLNGNNKMDSNPMGIPTEPYGASGKPSTFGPPTWNDTKVALPTTNPIVIKF
jgi:uncharacterized protein (DUF2141 family)